MAQRAPGGGIRSWDALKDAVQLNAGVYLTRMDVLRDLKQAGRLGNHVREDISRTLASNGMGHLPDKLPAYQEELVLIYGLGGPIGDLVRAVLHPSEEGAEALRNLNPNGAASKLKRIGELLDEIGAIIDD